MEFLVLSSRCFRRPGRERAVMQAVMEASEDLGAERVEARRGNVYSIGVYAKEGEKKILVYIDWDRDDWNWRRIYNQIVCSLQVQHPHQRKYGIEQTA